MFTRAAPEFGLTKASGQMKKTPTAATLDGWNRSIVSGGRKTVQFRQLLKTFGYERRSAQNQAAIQEWLAAQSLFVDFYDATSLDDSVTITAERIQRIGANYDKEIDIENRFEKDILSAVGLKSVVKQQYSPAGTRDKFDFLCKDSKGRAVVVELKARGGDKRAVEQVLRYIGMLKKEGGHKDPWGILVTGSADVHTRRALQGRNADDHIRWWIYGLDGDSISLKEVDPNAPE